MIITSAILFDLARSLTNAVPQSGDADIDVPSGIQPIITIISPVEITLNAPSADTFRQSVAFTNNFQRTNQAGTQLGILILGKGLWRIVAQLSATFNYSDLGSGGIPALSLAFLSTNNNPHLVHLCAAGAAATPLAGYSTTTTDMLLAKDTTMVLNIGQAPVGGTMNGQASAICTRLL